MIVKSQQYRIELVTRPDVFQFKSMPLTQVVVKDIEVTDLNALQQGREAKPLKVTYSC